MYLYLYWLSSCSDVFLGVCVFVMLKEMLPCKGLNLEKVYTKKESVQVTMMLEC